MTNIDIYKEKYIKYIVGDITNPIGNDNRFIIHCCNDCGKMGKGVAKALYEKWPQVRNKFIESYNQSFNSNLGDIQTVKIDKHLVVINIIGQHGIQCNENAIPPIRYDAIRECLKKVYILCSKHNASVHAPMFGAGLAGGNWVEISKIIYEELILSEKNINVIVYSVGE